MGALYPLLQKTRIKIYRFLAMSSIGHNSRRLYDSFEVFLWFGEGGDVKLQRAESESLCNPFQIFARIIDN